MTQILDLNTWSRKDHFHFFSQFEEPFFGVTVNVDCTIAYATAKAKGISFFLHYLHKSLQAANYVPSFRYRIVEDQVWIYDQVNASPTIGRADGSFGFSYMDYHEDFSEFKVIAEKEMETVRNSTSLFPAGSGDCVIHYSALPWVDFTSMSHARSFTFADSNPKISFGKLTESEGKRTMPVSIHVHHALMDGFHVGQFIERFQELLNEA
ncbi:chloramphenicol acetyltransferase [Pedobacter sp. PLR]|uniref:chloramphenicol acetyltransferase n=1 Tax=Pedobacter sp. PLR TaxID=2994465 RepID=UPI002246FFA1|nr:chloramphenicol acetyltransferase [Pedobacter sp. PLR]MCX2450977.1 chloramphenicol acetyltransferase [Pedobacter sp. PLR]